MDTVVLVLVLAGAAVYVIAEGVALWRRNFKKQP
jgi:hypothetical protein